jgi:hypothetical protein
MLARRHFTGAYELRGIVDAVVAAVFLEQPTIVFDQARTIAEMQAAADAVPEAMKVYEKEKPFVNPGVITAEEYEKLTAHHVAYLEFLEKDSDHARQLRLERCCIAWAGGLGGHAGVGLVVYWHLPAADVQAWDRAASLRGPVYADRAPPGHARPQYPGAVHPHAGGRRHFGHCLSKPLPWGELHPGGTGHPGGSIASALAADTPDRRGGCCVPTG